MALAADASRERRLFHCLDSGSRSCNSRKIAVGQVDHLVPLHTWPVSTVQRGQRKLSDTPNRRPEIGDIRLRYV